MAGERHDAETFRLGIEQTTDAGPFSPESLRPRLISREFYPTDDSSDQPQVTREVVNGVVYEKWAIPDFIQKPIPELVGDSH